MKNLILPIFLIFLASCNKSGSRRSIDATFDGFEDFTLEASGYDLIYSLSLLDKSGTQLLSADFDNNERMMGESRKFNIINIAKDRNEDLSSLKNLQEESVFYLAMSLGYGSNFTPGVEGVYWKIIITSDRNGEIKRIPRSEWRF